MCSSSLRFTTRHWRLKSHCLHILGPSPERHAYVVTISSEKQIKNSKESDDEVEESSGEKRLEIEKNSPTPPKRKVVEEVEKETSYVIPPPYNPPIPFSQRFVEAKVDSHSKGMWVYWKISTLMHLCLMSCIKREN